jgi:hypothetical protein
MLFPLGLPNGICTAWSPSARLTLLGPWHKNAPQAPASGAKWGCLRGLASVSHMAVKERRGGQVLAISSQTSAWQGSPIGQVQPRSNPRSSLRPSATSSGWAPSYWRKWATAEAALPAASIMNGLPQRLGRTTRFPFGGLGISRLVTWKRSGTALLLQQPAAGIEVS